MALGPSIGKCMTKNERKEDGARISTRLPKGWDERFDSPLARRWNEFVDCPKRLEKEAPFLLSILPKCGKRVLDAAMGTGCEAVFLAKQDFDVTGNEIDIELRSRAIAFAERERAIISFTDYDWCQLETRFGLGVFDATLILGNSLCLLQSEEARVKVAQNLRAICKKGGSVVVDERNFEYILKERRKILAGQFRFSGRVLYCGQRIRGRPIVIEEHRVRFVYEDLLNGAILGYLDMHPFRRNELIQLFRGAGFTRVDTYSDFEAGYDETADFFCYVFR